MAALATIGGFAACASLDHGPDLDRVAEHVVAAIGEAGTLPEGWEGAVWDRASPLDEHTAVRTALIRNRSIRAALERIAMARADLVQAGLLPNPVVNVAFGFPIDGDGGPVTVGAGVMQQLVAMWLRGDRIHEADLALEAEIVAVSQEALDLVRDVRRAHLRVVHTDLELEIVRGDEVLLDRLVEIVDVRRRAGEASTIDLGRAELRRRTLHAERAELERRRVTERLALLALIGLVDAPLEYSAVAAVRTPDVAERAEMDDDAIVAAVETRRLDVLAARIRADALAATGRLETRRRLGQGTAIGAEFGRGDDDRQHLGPSIAVEVPIFDNNDARIAHAAATYRRALHDAHRVRDDAVIGARAAAHDFRRVAELRAWCATDLLPATERQLDLVQQALDAGEIDLTVLLEAERDRNDARLRLNGLRLEEAFARVELDFQLGGRSGT